MGRGIMLATACSGGRQSELAGFLNQYSGFKRELLVNTTLRDPCRVNDQQVIETKIHDEVNFAKWVNFSIDVARRRGFDEVMWINSDIRIDPAHIFHLAAMLNNHNLLMLGIDFFNVVPADGLIIYRRPEVYVDHRYRPSAACFMVPARSPIRMDESYRWHYETDDFDYRCRIASGSGIAGISGHQPRDTPLKGDMAVWAAAGREKFKKQWGHLPHE